MKIIKTALVSFLILLLTFCLTLPASAAESSKVIYSNDFESGKIDDTFQVVYGNLSVVNEKDNNFLRCSHEGNRIHFAYGPEEQKNIDVSFKVRATLFTNETTATVSPFFRSPHIPAWDTISYQLQMKSFETSLIYADRFADDLVLSPIASYADFGMTPGLWNNIKISTRGERIIVYVNGDRIIEIADSAYGEAGGFGFTASYSSFDVDDIVITRYYGESLPEPDANEKPLWVGDISEKEIPDVADTGIVRIDLTTLGQEKVPVDRAINYIDPNSLGIYSWLTLIAAALCAVGAVTGVIAVVKKQKGR